MKLNVHQSSHHGRILLNELTQLVFVLPLGTVILGSSVLPHFFGYLALLLGVAFSLFGLVCLFGPFQYVVDYLAMGQGAWWLFVAITLLIRKEPIKTSVQ